MSRTPAVIFASLNPAAQAELLQAAAVQFQKDAWHASTHTNFQQCAIAAQFLGQQLAELVTDAEKLIPRPAPPKFTPPRPGN